MNLWTPFSRRPTMTTVDRVESLAVWLSLHLSWDQYDECRQALLALRASAVADAELLARALALLPDAIKASALNEREWFRERDAVLRDAAERGSE